MLSHNYVLSMSIAALSLRISKTVITQLPDLSDLVSHLYITICFIKIYLIVPDGYVGAIVGFIGFAAS